MITRDTNRDREQSLRKIAILVASLDKPLADRLLADLPTRDSAAVEEIVEQLDDVDPTEYRAVVADFRQGVVAPEPHQDQPPPNRLDGVELDESLVARMEAEETSSLEPNAPRNTDPWHSLSDSEAATLVEMLSAEQPQTIAVVLSRLETIRAAELIGKFSPAMQAEVLTRLAELDPADEQSLQVVESQLAEWIHKQRQRRQRMAAGRDLVQRILQNSPDDQRRAILGRLGERNPTLVESLSATSLDRPASAIRSQVPALHRKELQAFHNVAQNRTAPTTPSQPPARPQPESTAKAQSGALPLAPVRRFAKSETSDTTKNRSLDPLSDPLTELEALDDQSLLKALRAADRQTVMLALAGASEALMKRIVHGLPRRRANQFRQQVRMIGPTRLSDMLAAQRELVRYGQA